MVKSMLILLSAALLAVNFIDVNINTKNGYNLKEKYDSSLFYINTISKLEQHTDSIALQQKIAQGSAEYFMLLENVVSERFFHGYSHLRLNENWVAAVGERFFGHGLGSKVLPEDIIKRRAAACSQQVIVMMEIAKRKNIDYRSLGFPHHYALELKINNTWYFFDPNLEPDLNKEERSALHWQTMASSLKQHYKPEVQKTFDTQFGVNVMPVFGIVNANPAPRAAAVQFIMLILSRTLWLFPLILLFAKSRKKVRAYKLQMAYKTNNELIPMLSA